MPALLEQSSLLQMFHLQHPYNKHHNDLRLRLEQRKYLLHPFHHLNL
jgi:hypothetical protein